MLVFLAVTPQEEREASRYTRSFAHAAYRIGPDSTLLRRDLLMQSQGGLLLLSDRDAPGVEDPQKLAAALVRECARRDYSGVALDFERVPPRADLGAAAGALAPLLARGGKRLYLPESCAAAAPGAFVLVNTAVSGGNLTQLLREAQGRYGGLCALDLQRLAMDFTLPEPSGEGRPLRTEQLTALLQEQAPSVFFSQDLCARYFTYTAGGQTHFVLFDDADTLAQKLRIGSALGIRAAFLMYPEVTDLLAKLFRQGR